MPQPLELRISRQGAAGAEPAHGVRGRLIALLAVAAGMTVANLYYAQPLLSSLREVFHKGFGQGPANGVGSPAAHIRCSEDPSPSYGHCLTGSG
ncbi:hypothetical protein ACWDZ8_29590 [Streptomyces sp. NPDC003233]